tara:strand:+ start:14026 stop:14295 length:270 start_codon:yes stop_codon:yes gene_type:complete
MTPEDLLRDALDETGVSLRQGKEEALALIALEGARLTLAFGEPGFNLALRASRDQVALQLGIKASRHAREVDGRIVGIIQSSLLMLASA